MKRYYPGGSTPDWHRYLVIAVALIAGIAFVWGAS